VINVFHAKFSSYNFILANLSANQSKDKCNASTPKNNAHRWRSSSWWAGRAGNHQCSCASCNRGVTYLIKVHAAGVNGADLREREGKYPVPPGAPEHYGA
jgi:hypothetical protein